VTEPGLQTGCLLCKTERGAYNSASLIYCVYRGSDSRLPDYSLALIAYRLPLTVYRLPLTDYRLPITVYRSPLTDLPSASRGSRWSRTRL